MSFGRASAAGGGRPARPRYPAALFDWLADRTGAGPATRVLEIGAGSGEATRPLLALGVASLTAVEPDPDQAARLARLVQAEPRLSVAAVEFDGFTAPLASFDLVAAAASFHWLARGRALARAAALLSHGGWVALWWQVFEDSRRPDAFAARVAPLFEGLEEGPKGAAPRTPFALDVAARMGELRRAGFIDAEHRLLTETVRFDAAGLIALYGTLSRVAGAPHPVRRRLFEGVEAILADSFGGAVDREVATSAFIARRPSRG